MTVSALVHEAPSRATTPAESRSLAERALSRATGKLLDMQREEGFWKAELETNVTMDAEDLFLRQFLGIRGERETRETAAWIRSKQLEDGGWAIHPGAEPDVSTTVEAYTALRLAGDPADADHMRKASAFARAMGGIEGSRVFTRTWLALFGEWSWDDLPALPPEVILLPHWFPLNIYDFGCWARQTIVPLTVLGAHRPSRELGFALPELHVPRHRVPGGEAQLAPWSTWAGRFQRLDRALHLYEKRPLRRLRRQSLRLCAEWILRRQEADGCWGGIQPPWVYSLMALDVLGYPLDHPALRKGIEGLDAFAISQGGMRRFEACQSPVWDTALSAVALRDAGLPPEHPALARAAGWLLDREVRIRGDWSVRRPQLEPGGWAFEFENRNYPDLDDTAEVVLALRAAEHSRPERTLGSIRRALDWTFGMQCRHGGWAAFDVDNTRALCGELPFCDFGEVIDPPSADVTAHVIEMLAEETPNDPRLRKAIAWLLDEQEPDGSWFGRWGANHLYGTGAAVPALIRSGTGRDHPAIRRAVAWLEGVQNEDGGFGEDLRSYGDPGWRGCGESTPSQTAWGLLALLDADGPSSEAVRRGIGWLVRSQREDGGWDEPQFTGTGFPGDFYIRYHLYALNFPVMALGRYVRG